MKLTIALLLIAATSFGQGRPSQMPSANRSFVTPFEYYALDTTKAYKVGIFAVIDNVSTPAMSVFTYGLFTANGKLLEGSKKNFVCKGSCYELWDANDNNSPFQILSDSVLHKAIVQ